jgi:outer membrane protein assembly factor BamB
MKNYTLALVVLIISSALLAQEAQQWRGPDRNGIYPETGLLKSWPADGPELLWHFDDLGNGYSSVAVTDDAIYTSGADDYEGFVYALDHSGNLLWKSAYGKEWTESYEGSRTTPLFYDNKLYMTSGMGKIFCLSPDDGSIIWEVDLIEKYGAPNIKWGITENLAFLDDKIFCTPGGEEHNIIALDKDEGTLVWTSKAKGETSAYCSPNVIKHNGRDILLTQTAASIVALEANTGKLLWSHPQPNKWSVHANTPYYADGRVYCVSGYGQGGVAVQLADDGNSVEELWRETNIDGRMGSFVVMDGYVYGPADQGLKWYGLNWETGETIYGESMIKKGNITAADGMLYLYGEDGKIMLAEPAEGKIIEKSVFRVPHGSNQHWVFPVFADKKLYVRHGNSLMVYDVAAE